MKSPRKNLAAQRRLIASCLVAALMLLGSFFYEAVAVVRLPQSDHPAEFYTNQLSDDLRLTMTAAIASAKQSIVLMVYSLTDEKVISALKAKAAEGVSVHVVVDAKACPAAKRRLGSQVTTIRRSPTGLMHLKILVVDEEQVWMGSANMTYESLRVHGNLMIAMHHPELAQAIVARALTMPSSGTLAKVAPLVFGLPDQNGELWFLPNGVHAYEKVIHLIEQAKSRIAVAMFTWTRPDFVATIVDAFHRGVDVEVFIDRRQGQGVGAEVVHTLVNAGIPVYFNRGEGLLHHKSMMVDNQILVTGSANWTRSAFKNNDDCFLVLEPLTAEQTELLNRLWDRLRVEGEIQNHVFDRIEPLAPLDPLGGHECTLGESLTGTRRVA